MKVSLLGLDGLPPWLLRRAASQLGLRFLSRALAEGRLFGLRSMPPITPVAWTSMASGVGPAKHGVWGFTKYYREGNSHRSRPYTALDVMFPRAFEDAALMGLDVLVANWPLTWPLRALCCLNRMTVVGDTFLAPRVEYWPQGLESRVGGHFRTFDDVRDPYTRTSMLIEGMMRLLDESDSDLAMFVLPFPDQAFHKDYREVLSVGPRSAEVWRQVDSLAEEMARRSSTFMLASDHGVGTYTTCVNVIAPLMKATGVGVPRDLKGRLVLRLASIADLASLLLPPSLSPRRLARDGRLPWLRSAFEREMAPIARAGRPGGGESELSEAPFTYDAGGLSISRLLLFRGEAEREEGLRALMSSGITRYLRVQRAEERFRGAYMPEYPALFIESLDEDKYHPVSSRGLALHRRDVFPDHHVIGTLLVYGEASGLVGASEARVEDVGPTLLSLLGLPEPRGAEGASLAPTHGSYPYDAAWRLRRARQLQGA